MADVIGRHLLEGLLDLAGGVVLVLRVRLDRLALARQRLEQVVDLVVDGRAEAVGLVVMAGASERSCGFPTYVCFRDGARRRHATCR